MKGLIVAARAGWLDGRDEIAILMREVHRARHNAGREERRLRNAEIASLRQSGQEKRAEALDEHEWKRGIAFARRKRLREEIEARKGQRRFRGSVPEADRIRKVGRAPASLFEQFEAKQRSGDGGVRDLYYEVISRGLHSGRIKDYKRHLKRSSSRSTPWKSGEMGRKISYIVRDDALELVEGNLITNMGASIEEAIACTRVIQQIEELSRENAGVYKHVIVGLPYHLSPQARAELLKEITAPLQEMRLPFLATLHLPSAKGDQRNFHAHIVVSLRPMNRIGDHEWEFDAGKSTWLDTSAALRLQRRFIAGAFNRALEAADETVRWTGRSRAERGQTSPGNTKQSQEGNRAQRGQDDVEQALSKALGNVATVEYLDQDFTALDTSFGELGRVVERFDHAGGEALRQISELSAAINDQVATLEKLIVDCGALQSRVLEQQAEPGPIPSRNGLISNSKTGAALEKHGGRDRQRSSTDAQPATSDKMAPAQDRNVAAATFDELERRRIDEVERIQHYKAARLRKPEVLTSAFARADAIAHFEIEQMEGRFDKAALDRVRASLLSVPPVLTVEPSGPAGFRLFTAEVDLFRDVATVCESEAGRAYLRLVLADAPSPPLDRRQLRHLLLTRREKNVSAHHGTEPALASPPTMVEDDNVALDVQGAFIAARGRSR